MAKANSSFSEVQIARRIKEGRGVDAAVALVFRFLFFLKLKCRICNLCFRWVVI